MDEVLAVRVPKGMRRRIQRCAKAQHITVSELVLRALGQDEPLASLEAARAELIPQARAQDVYTDEDVFALLS